MQYRARAAGSPRVSDRYVYIGLGFLFLISSVGLLYKRVQYNNQLLTSMRLEEQNNEAAQFGLDSNNYNIYNNNKEAPQVTVSKEVTQETKEEQGHEETKQEQGQGTKLIGCFQDVHGERVLPKYIGMKTYEQCLQSSIDSGTSHFGLEGGSEEKQECWVGNSPEVGKHGSAICTRHNEQGKATGGSWTVAVYERQQQQQ